MRRRGRPFPRGTSGNPGGRPREAVHVRELAREHTEEAIETLTAIMRRGKTEQARVRATEALLNRAWGHPTQPVEHEHQAPAFEGAVLVMGGDEQEYIAGLRRAREMVDQAGQG